VNKKINRVDAVHDNSQRLRVQRVALH
jgi:hypothetical protein